jgi:DNA-binding LytR/AlgR family response regulator
MMQNSLNILIIEDELLIAEMLKEMLLELECNVVAVAKNYDSALDVFEKRKDINFAILDINLSDTKTGLDVAKKINDEFKIPFIFLTSYSDTNTIKEAIALKPESYLIKPFSKTDLYVTLEIINARKKVVKRILIIKDGHLTVKIKHQDIFWVKSDNIYLEVKTDEKTYLVRNSLDKFIEELSDSNFIRIHRSYAVNMEHIKAVNGQYIIIKDEKIPLSRNYRDELMERFVRE